MSRPSCGPMGKCPMAVPTISVASTQSLSILEKLHSHMRSFISTFSIYLTWHQVVAATRAYSSDFHPGHCVQYVVLEKRGGGTRAWVLGWIKDTFFALTILSTSIDPATQQIGRLFSDQTKLIKHSIHMDDSQGRAVARWQGRYISICKYVYTYSWRQREREISI